MIHTEVVTQNHLDGFEVQSLVSHVDMCEIDYRDVLHKFLMVMADFEVREVSDQNLKICAANSRVHSLVFLHFPVRKQLVDKRFVHTAVRRACVQNDTDFLPRHRAVQQRMVVTFF